MITDILYSLAFRVLPFSILPTHLSNEELPLSSSETSENLSEHSGVMRVDDKDDHNERMNIPHIEEKRDEMFWSVLDNGFVRCEDIFGDETVIVNAARVSFGKRKSFLDEQDDKLIGYLLKHQHYSPFRHVMFRFHVKAPEFVLRQWYKHVVGCEWTSSMPSQLHGWNEISGRYVDSFHYYFPEVWRKQSQDKKQGSDGIILDQNFCNEIFQESITTSLETYRALLDKGVAKEQARIVLPLNMYTEVIWTPSLQALFHFVKLRDEDHAQYEIREYAKICASILEEKFPIVWKHMMKI